MKSFGGWRAVLAGGALWLLGSGTVCADTVYLTNGGKLEGRVRVGNGKVVIEQAAGTITIDESRVSHIERGRTPLDEFDQRWKTLREAENQDADAYADLGAYAAAQNMRQQSQSAYQQALRLNADHEGARRALGFVKFDGRWMTSDEAQQARGMVKHDGAWVTPEAKADLMRLEAETEIRRNEAEAAKSRAEAERLRVEQLDREMRLAEEDRLRRYYDSGPFFYRFLAGYNPPGYCPPPICPPVVRPEPPKVWTPPAPYEPPVRGIGRLPTRGRRAITPLAQPPVRTNPPAISSPFEPFGGYR